MKIKLNESPAIWTEEGKRIAERFELQNTLGWIKSLSAKQMLSDVVIDSVVRILTHPIGMEIVDLRDSDSDSIISEVIIEVLSRKSDGTEYQAIIVAAALSRIKEITKEKGDSYEK